MNIEPEPVQHRDLTLIRTLTWCLMSEFCLSPKIVPLSYCTEKDFAEFGAAFSTNVKGLGLSVLEFFTNSEAV